MIFVTFMKSVYETGVKREGMKKKQKGGNEVKICQEEILRKVNNLLTYSCILQDTFEVVFCPKQQRDSIFLPIPEDLQKEDTCQIHLCCAQSLALKVNE